MSASMDNPSIADLGGVTSGWLNVDGLDVGDTFWSWSYSFEYDFDNGYDCDNRYEDRTDSMSTEVVDPNRRIISVTQQIIDESTQGQEVVECGRFKIIVKYDVGCPPPNHTLELIGHIQDDAILQTTDTQLLNNQSDELCTYELTNLYKMKNRLDQTIGTGFTSYTARLTWNGKSVTKVGPGISTRATIAGVGSCP